MKRPIALVSASFLLSFLWGYAAFSKLAIYDKFQLQLEQLPYVGTFSHILVWLLPSVEILVAIVLIFQSTYLKGLYTSLALLTMFTAYLTAMKLLKHDLHCGCGGIISGFTWVQHIWFNLSCMVIAVTGIILNHTKQIKERTTVSKVDYTQQISML